MLFSWLQSSNLYVNAAMHCPLVQALSRGRDPEPIGGPLRENLRRRLSTVLQLLEKVYAGVVDRMWTRFWCARPPHAP